MLLKNIHSLVTCDNDKTVLNNVDMLIEDGLIKTIGKDIEAPNDIELIDASELIIYPGLVNTHHHFFQAFVRNRVDLDWSKLSLIEWLDTIYPIFAKVDEDCIYHSSVTSIGELIKSGCTTAFDHQYNYTKNAGSYLIDRQIEAAKLFGMRFHAGRGTNTLPQSEGSTIPDLMRDTTEEFIFDCERLAKSYHDPGYQSMQQIVVAPCQPINCYESTFIESVNIARQFDLSMHTHLGEGEKFPLKERSGFFSIDWCEKYDFIGDKTWFAHGWEFTEAEIDQLAASNTGISHCPAPVFLVGEEMTNTSYMHKQGLRLGLGVDGPASNDSSNLNECIRQAYLLQCLNAKNLSYPIPEASDFLIMATRGGADCLNRNDIGSLQEGMCADFFGIAINKLEYVSTLHDPMALPAKIGINGPVDITVINGEFVWRDGEFPGLDEAKLVHEANLTAQRLR